MQPRETVLLIPGLFSPRWHMWGLHRALERRGFSAPIWDDASVFGDLETSIGRLQRDIIKSEARGVVTHSFGDWLFRQAAARHGPQSVRSLVSLVPVMTSSMAAKLLRPLRVVAPEIGVMADAERAGGAAQTPAEVDRLIVWSRVDPWVRQVETKGLAGTRSTVVPGTHNTVLWQPRVQQLTADHLQAALNPTQSL